MKVEQRISVFFFQSAMSCRTVTKNSSLEVGIRVEKFSSTKHNDPQLVATASIKIIVFVGTGRASSEKIQVPCIVPAAGIKIYLHILCKSQAI